MDTLIAQMPLAEGLGFAVGAVIVLLAVGSGIRWHRRPPAQRGGVPTGLGAVILIVATVLLGLAVWRLIK